MATPDRAVRQLTLQGDLSDANLFRDPNLFKVVKAACVKMATMDDWRDAFDSFFPPWVDIQQGHCEALPNPLYRSLWLAYAKNNSRYRFNVLRQVLWHHFFKTLVWVPLTGERRF